MLQARHGFEIHSLDVPRGVNPPAGRFGRLFPTLDPRLPTGLAMAEAFGLPGGLMDGGETTHAQDSPTLDAGFTFFGQFIDHNVTFDVTGQFGRQVDPEAVRNFRQPMLDLDHLYGSGPVADPHLYDTTSHNTKLVLSPDGVDFARTSTGVPLIGDPRNDENLLLSQLHLAFIKFHNRVVDALAAGEITDVFGDLFPPAPSTTPPPPNASIDQLLAVRTYYDDLFDKAQQIVRWHFQWIIVHEYLPLVCGQDSVDRVNRNGLQFYAPEGDPYIPVEFAVAAFRFMHPTIRSEYTINDKYTLPLFPLNFTDPLPPPDQRTDLRGGPVAPEFAVDFTQLFAIDGDRIPQRAKRIEAKLNVRLLDLSPITDVPAEIARQLRSLAVRNLLRSEAQELPSAQDIARKIGEVPLSDAELGTTGPIYLWYYILKEADLRHNGGRLGPFTMAAGGWPADDFVANPAGTPVPFGFTFDDHGHLVVTDATTSTLSTYTIHPEGTVTHVASRPDGQVAMCWVAHTTGNFYVANTGSNTLTGYHIDPAGTPTVSLPQIPTRQGPVDLAGTRDGQFLYVQVGTAGGIDGFRIKPDGTLAQIVTLPGPTGAEGIAVN